MYLVNEKEKLYNIPPTYSSHIYIKKHHNIGAWTYKQRCLFKKKEIYNHYVNGKVSTDLLCSRV